MSSQKKSSTKVRAKNSALSGQRQNSNLSKSKRTASVKAPSKSRTSVAFVARTTDQVSRGNGKQLMRTGLRSELFKTMNPTAGLEFQLMDRLRINPLSKAVFQWLPTIAQNFESFKFHRLSFRYENRCSSSTPGSLIISPSYDASDSSAQAATEALIYQNKGTVDFSVWKNGVLHVDCKSLNRLYKSHTCMSDERFAVTTQDKKTVDSGQIFICLDGVPAATPTGKIFIDYDVEFFEPHAPTEPLNQGGEAVVQNGVIVNSSTPFNTLPTNIKKEISPILLSLTDLVTQGLQPSPVGSNTAILGQFLKDYSGLLNLDMDGSGLSITNLGLGLTQSSVRNWLNTESLVPLATGTAVMFNSGNTQARGIYSIAAKAGDYLKFRSPNVTALDGLTMRMGGAGLTF